MENQQTQPLTIRLPADLHSAARHKSLDTGKSLNEVIIEKLTEWVKEPAGKSKIVKATAK